MGKPLRSELFVGPYCYPVVWTIQIEAYFEKPIKVDEYGDSNSLCDAFGGESHSMWAIPEDYEHERKNVKHSGFTFYSELPEDFVDDPERRVQALFGKIFGMWKVDRLYAWLTQEQTESTDPSEALTIHQCYYVYQSNLLKPMQRYALNGRLLRDFLDMTDDTGEIGPFTKQLLTLASMDEPLTTQCSFPFVKERPSCQ